ncbi:universal stress protein UspC [Escherichia coli]|nr:universal stress protein UspC [Escherichia coli]
MSYSNILVAVAVTPESQQLLAKAVSIARPVKGHIQFNYSRFRPGNVQSISCADAWKIYAA